MSGDLIRWPPPFQKSCTRPCYRHLLGIESSCVSQPSSYTRVTSRLKCQRLTLLRPAGSALTSLKSEFSVCRLFTIFKKLHLLIIILSFQSEKNEDLLKFHVRPILGRKAPSAAHNKNTRRALTHLISC